MKITELSIVFVLIFFPFFYILTIHSDDAQKANEMAYRYKTALQTAVIDAGAVMHQNEKQYAEAGYDSAKFVKADKELALSTFTQTMALNMGIQDDQTAIQHMFDYIPAIVILDYDGYYIFAKETELTGKIENSYKHVWSPKKPYTYSDSDGNSINFTLDGYVHAFDAGAGRWIEGFQHELAATSTISLFQDSTIFEQVRRSRIVTGVQNELADVINNHNEFARKNGVSYLFTMPLISQEDWYNSINDIGIMAFVQGIAVGDQKVNNYAIGGGRLVKKTAVVGGVDPVTNIKYHYPATCNPGFRADEVFTHPRQAAAKGYFEFDCSS
ncbi:hypothetical protein PAECIP112173_01531 [Paenibacillus sp. JJ-100]|uniref:hypothetical protein n=1 Tax=Paenibacillus sp. JJ-100 TaxID=2974896 RepID=UPI0022FF5B92|nr:hypothetical protein [Paenibacillus sp. JJ-100]CAI6054610.1 hypothetical protein PAECIP112173_01531 [Paenibacillus sp. JJ-100]